MKKILPILSVIFAVAVFILSIVCITARINFNHNNVYNIDVATSLCSVVYLVIAIIHGGLIFICNSRGVKVLLLIAIYPFFWLSPTLWAFFVSFVIYIIAYLASKSKFTKIGLVVIIYIIVLHVLLYVGLIYLFGPAETLSTEEYISPNGTYVVIVETFHHNDIGASDTFVSYRMNESIDGVFFDLLPKEKSLVEFIPNIDEDTEPIWTSDNVLIFEGEEYHLSKYEWK